MTNINEEYLCKLIILQNKQQNVLQEFQLVKDKFIEYNNAKKGNLPTKEKILKECNKLLQQNIKIKFNEYLDYFNTNKKFFVNIPNEFSDYLKSNVTIEELDNVYLMMDIHNQIINSNQYINKLYKTLNKLK